MKISEKIKKFVNNPNKIIFSAYFSALITFLFAIYNIFLGLYYADSWSISFSIYYLCLTCARVIVILIERKVNAYPQDFAVSIRKKACIGLSIFMFFIDLCLFAPITLMLLRPKAVAFGMIPAIVIATYTTYKIIAAIINYNKAKRGEKLTYKLLRALSIVDALVSVLSLQHILIMVNGGMTFEMLVLSAVSSFIILLIILIFSVTQIVYVTKKYKWF